MLHMRKTEHHTSALLKLIEFRELCRAYKDLVGILVELWRIEW